MTNISFLDFILSLAPAAAALAFTIAVLWAIISMFPELEAWMIAKFDRICGVSQEKTEKSETMPTRYDTYV